MKKNVTMLTEKKLVNKAITSPIKDGQAPPKLVASIHESITNDNIGRSPDL